MKKIIPNVGDVCRVEFNFNLFEGIDEVVYVDRFHPASGIIHARAGQIVIVVSRRVEALDHTLENNNAGFYAFLFPNGRMGCRDFNMPEYYTEEISRYSHKQSPAAGPWFKKIR